MFMYRVSLVINRNGNPAAGKPLYARRMLARVAIGQFLGMTLWFSATAAGPAIAREFLLTRSATAWLTMAVQAGVFARNVLSRAGKIPDVPPPRPPFALRWVVGGGAKAGFPPGFP